MWFVVFGHIATIASIDNDIERWFRSTVECVGSLLEAKDNLMQKSIVRTAKMVAFI